MELSDNDKNLLANASRLIWAKGTNNKTEGIIAVNFQDLVERLCKPPEMPAVKPLAPEDKGGN